MNGYTEFRKTIAWVFAMFPGVSITAAQTEAWWSLFDAYPADLVRDSARLMISERADAQFPPTAIELMRYVKAGAPAHAARKKERPGRPALPEPGAESLLGPDHPVTAALREMRDGVVGAAALARAIAESLEARANGPVAHDVAPGTTQDEKEDRAAERP